MNASPLAAVLYAKDAQRLARFYAQALALARAEEDPTFVRLLGAGIELTIVQAPRAIADAIEIAAPPALREDVPAKLSYLVPDVEALRSPIAQLGGGLKAPEAAWSWRGLRHLDGWDPEGNVIQLRQREA